MEDEQGGGTEIIFGQHFYPKNPEEEEGGGPEKFSGQNFSPKNPEIQEGEEESVSNKLVMQWDWSKNYEGVHISNTLGVRRTSCIPKFGPKIFNFWKTGFFSRDFCVSQPVSPIF
jgi:hypothetical protein